MKINLEIEGLNIETGNDEIMNIDTLGVDIEISVDEIINIINSISNDNYTTDKIKKALQNADTLEHYKNAALARVSAIMKNQQFETQINYFTKKKAEQVADKLESSINNPMSIIGGYEPDKNGEHINSLLLNFFNHLYGVRNEPDDEVDNCTGNNTCNGDCAHCRDDAKESEEDNNKSASKEEEVKSGFIKGTLLNKAPSLLPGDLDSFINSCIEEYVNSGSYSTEKEYMKAFSELRSKMMMIDINEYETIKFPAFKQLYHDILSPLTVISSNGPIAIVISAMTASKKYKKHISKSTK